MAENGNKKSPSDLSNYMNVCFPSEKCQNDLIAPRNLNSEKLLNIYEKRVDDFEPPDILEIQYSKQGELSRELIFVDRLNIDSRPRMLVSYQAVASMQKCVSILCKKIDSQNSVIKRIREEYYKELYYLRQIKKYVEENNLIPKTQFGDIQYFNPTSYIDNSLVDLLNSKIATVTKSLQEKLTDLIAKNQTLMEKLSKAEGNEVSAHRQEAFGMNGESLKTRVINLIKGLSLEDVITMLLENGGGQGESENRRRMYWIKDLHLLCKKMMKKEVGNFGGDVTRLDLVIQSLSGITESKIEVKIREKEKKEEEKKWNALLEEKNKEISQLHSKIEVLLSANAKRTPTPADSPSRKVAEAGGASNLLAQSTKLNSTMGSATGGNALTASLTKSNEALTEQVNKAKKEIEQLQVELQKERDEKYYWQKEMKMNIKNQTLATLFEMAEFNKEALRVEEMKKAGDRLVKDQESPRYGESGRESARKKYYEESSGNDKSPRAHLKQSKSLRKGALQRAKDSVDGGSFKDSDNLKSDGGTAEDNEVSSSNLAHSYSEGSAYAENKRGKRRLSSAAFDELRRLNSEMSDEANLSIDEVEDGVKSPSHTMPRNYPSRARSSPIGRPESRSVVARIMQGEKASKYSDRTIKRMDDILMLEREKERKKLESLGLWSMKSIAEPSFQIPLHNGVKEGSNNEEGVYFKGAYSFLDIENTLGDVTVHPGLCPPLPSDSNILGAHVSHVLSPSLSVKSSRSYVSRYSPARSRGSPFPSSPSQTFHWTSDMAPKQFQPLLLNKGKEIEMLKQILHLASLLMTPSPQSEETDALSESSFDSLISNRLSVPSDTAEQKPFESLRDMTYKEKKRLFSMANQTVYDKRGIIKEIYGIAKKLIQGNGHFLNLGNSNPTPTPVASMHASPIQRRSSLRIISQSLENSVIPKKSVSFINLACDTSEIRSVNKTVSPLPSMRVSHMPKKGKKPTLLISSRSSEHKSRSKSVGMRPSRRTKSGDTQLENIMTNSLAVSYGSVKNIHAGEFSIRESTESLLPTRDMPLNNNIISMVKSVINYALHKRLGMVNEKDLMILKHIDHKDLDFYLECIENELHSIFKQEREKALHEQKEEIERLEKILIEKKEEFERVMQVDIEQIKDLHLQLDEKNKWVERKEKSFCELTRAVEQKETILIKKYEDLYIPLIIDTIAVECGLVISEQDLRESTPEVKEADMELRSMNVEQQVLTSIENGELSSIKENITKGAEVVNNPLDDSVKGSIIALVQAKWRHYRGNQNNMRNLSIVVTELQQMKETYINGITQYFAMVDHIEEMKTIWKREMQSIISSQCQKQDNLYVALSSILTELQAMDSSTVPLFKQVIDYVEKQRTLDILSEVGYQNIENMLKYEIAPVSLSKARFPLLVIVTESMQDLSAPGGNLDLPLSPERQVKQQFADIDPKSDSLTMNDVTQIFSVEELKEEVDKRDETNECEVQHLFERSAIEKIEKSFLLSALKGQEKSSIISKWRLPIETAIHQLYLSEEKEKKIKDKIDFIYHVLSKNKLCSVLDIEDKADTSISHSTRVEAAEAIEGGNIVDNRRDAIAQLTSVIQWEEKDYYALDPADISHRNFASSIGTLIDYLKKMEGSKTTDALREGKSTEPEKGKKRFFVRKKYKNLPPISQHGKKSSTELSVAIERPIVKINQDTEMGDIRVEGTLSFPEGTKELKASPEAKAKKLELDSLMDFVDNGGFALKKNPEGSKLLPKNYLFSHKDSFIKARPTPEERLMVTSRLNCNIHSGVQKYISDYVLSPGEESRKTQASKRPETKHEMTKVLNWLQSTKPPI